MKKLFAATLATFCFAFPSSTIFAQEQQTLFVGDKAPALDIAKYVSLGQGKFQPVTKFEEGKVYVVEFWATWCGPCIQSMPHLAELQEKYAEKGLQIVSVTDDELPAIEKLMGRDAQNARGDDKTYGDITSHYTLASDPDNSVAKDYMMATRQSGIPCAFIVGREGLLEWVGHPGEIEQPLTQVLDGKWDRTSFAERFQDEQKIIDLQTEFQQVASQLGPKANEPAELLKAITPVMDKYLQALKTPVYKEQVLATKLQLLLQAAPTDPETLKTLDTILSSSTVSPVFKHDIAWKTYELSMEREDFSVAVLQRLVEGIPSILEQLSEDSQPTVLDTLAHLKHRLGEKEEALEIAQKAYKLSGENPEYEKFVEQLNSELGK